MQMIREEVIDLSNASTIWAYLTEAGMTKAGAAGMMGNIRAESGLNPKNVEDQLERRISYTDDTYTAAIDSGRISRAEFLNPLPGKVFGYGLCQWTSTGRKAGLYDLCRAKGVSIGDLETQLEFLVKELKESYYGVWKVLTNTENVLAASNAVLTQFEMPADQGTAVRNTRYSYSMGFYSDFAGEQIAEKYTAFMERIAADASHGYSQASRWGKPDYDCSSLVITALEYAGIPALNNGIGYTGNMCKLLGLGFTDVVSQVNLSTGSGLQRGDILLNHVHHTAVYVGNGKIVHARGQRYGSSAPGDQGQEIAVTSYYNYPWNAVYRYGGGVKTGGGYMFTVNTVRNGVSGKSVLLCQRLLKVGDYKGADGKELVLDGDCGANTVHAIKAFQKAKALEVDGICGEKTWKILLDV